MTTLAALETAARHHQLDLFGAFPTTPDDGLPQGIGSVALFGPREPGFWSAIKASPEWNDGTPDAVDRWSTRVISDLADEFAGIPLFPFSGPPWQPFINWARRSGRAWTSEVGILIHDTAGLMVSYRGAVGLYEPLEFPPAGGRPCDTCEAKPCLFACPVGALGNSGYDIPACKDYLDTRIGSETCMSGGCSVRLACPVSKEYGRLAEQSAYHMRHFLG